MGGVEEALIIFIVKRKLNQPREADRPSPGEQNGLFGLKKSQGGPKLIPSMMSIQIVKMAFLFFTGHRAVCVSLRVTRTKWPCPLSYPGRGITPIFPHKSTPSIWVVWGGEIIVWNVDLHNRYGRKSCSDSPCLISRDSLLCSECWCGYVTDQRS